MAYPKQIVFCIETNQIFDSVHDASRWVMQEGKSQKTDQIRTFNVRISRMINNKPIITKRNGKTYHGIPRSINGYSFVKLDKDEPKPRFIIHISIDGKREHTKKFQRYEMTTDEDGSIALWEKGANRISVKPFWIRVQDVKLEIIKVRKVGH